MNAEKSRKRLNEQYAPNHHQYAGPGFHSMYKIKIWVKSNRPFILFSGRSYFTLTYFSTQFAGGPDKTLFMLLQIDWRTLLLGEEEWSFLYEVLLRSAVMFLVAITAMRAIGRRGTKQGVFELVLIITLGSAAGDPMFYKKVGVLPAILVFGCVVIMYKIINFLTARIQALDDLIEGTHVRLIRGCRFAVENTKLENLRHDELFEDLRQHNVKHLGQIESAYIEASGQLSVYFLPDDKVEYGLPVLPELFEKQIEEIKHQGIYSCSHCGNTKEIAPARHHTCEICENKIWVKSINDRRVK